MDSLLEIALNNALVATVLAVVVFSISRFVRYPALCHAFWVLVLVKLVTPPIVSVPLPAGWGRAQEPKDSEVAPGDKAIESTPVEAFVDEPDAFFHSEDSRGVGIQTDTPNRVAAKTAAAPVPPPGVNPAPETSSIGVLRNVLLGAWLVGTVVALFTTVLRIYWFHRTLRLTKPASADLQDEVRELAGRIGIKRCPDVCLVSAALGPMLWAVWGRPKILFPARLYRELSPETRRPLLLHELSHLRRRDHWVRMLEAAVTILYWWHPVVWWARREIRPLEEACCDSWVVSEMPDSRDTYAEALVEAIRFRSGPRPFLPPATSGVGSFVSVKRRVTMIMQGEHRRGLSRAGRLIVVAATVCLPLLPVLAQRDKTPPKSPESTASNAEDASPKSKSGAKVKAGAPLADDEAEVRERKLMESGLRYCRRLGISKHDEPKKDDVLLEGSLGLLHRSVTANSQADQGSLQVQLLERLVRHSWARYPNESVREMFNRLEQLDNPSNAEITKLKKLETEFRAISSRPWPFDWRAEKEFWCDLLELMLLSKLGQAQTDAWQAVASSDARRQRLCRIAYLVSVRQSKGAKVDYAFIEPLGNEQQPVTHQIRWRAEILQTLLLAQVPVDDPHRIETRDKLLNQLRDHLRRPGTDDIDESYALLGVLGKLCPLADERTERDVLVEVMVRYARPWEFWLFAHAARLRQAKVRELSLGKPVRVEYDRAPVGAVLRDLASQVCLSIWIDHAVFDENVAISVQTVERPWVDVVEMVLSQTPYRLHMLRSDVYWIGKPADAQAASAMLAQGVAKIPPGRLKIADALKDDTRLEFVDAPLEYVGEYLGDAHDINFLVLDRHEFPVTIDLKFLPLHLALTIMGDQNDCDWHAASESIAIGSRERIKEFAKLEWKSVQRAARLSRVNPKVLKKLEEDTRFEFPGNPLADLAEFVERFHHIKVTVAPGSPDLRLRNSIKGVTLAWSLDQALFVINLTWDTDGEQIFVGTEAQVAEFMKQAKRRAESDEP